MILYKDYMIVLSPSRNVKGGIKQCKNSAKEHIGNYPGLNSIAHISLWDKQCVSPELIQAFISILQRKISKIPPVNLTVDGFDFFVHGADTMTIYTSLQSNPIVDDWFKIVRKQLNLNSNRFVPHITVTKNIPVDLFYTLWPMFSSMPFKINFVPESISVLERDPLIPFAKWHTCKEIYFKNTHQF